MSPTVPAEFALNETGRLTLLLKLMALTVGDWAYVVVAVVSNAPMTL